MSYLHLTIINPNEKLQFGVNDVILFLEKYFPNSEYKGEKFFKKYSISKLKTSDFVKLESEEFYKNIFENIINETSDNEFLERCRIKLYQKLNFKTEFYYLKASDESISKFYKDCPIWDYFYLYLNIDRNENKFKIIEFAND